MWDTLVAISHTMNDPWCVLGDFNSVLHQGERVGGNEADERKMRDFGEYRALHNGLWFDMFDFTHVSYQAHSLSVHTPIVLAFPVCPCHQKAFIKDAQFKEIVKHNLDKCVQGPALKLLLSSLRKPLLLLNKHKFADIYAQQIREDIKRQHYVTITHSAIALMKQQSKVEWIGFGDECSRHFMAKLKQRKAMQCIYQITDRNDQWVEGFDRVAEIMTGFYHDLLGRQEQHRSRIDLEVIGLGHTLNLDQQMRLCQPFNDNEIKQALFSIPNYKSPGLDGFNSGFYKAS
ncbi:LOW QUALITY PROTEIN: hypothetical protein Cgig2_030510 [Carnegiea gigantea]|uniref:Reverse transcriptase n=1 Tax=Carnegiea gigantea TaxID=171969 RepID=A0A9Q1GH49_9CARY|nr:LOW QUALITY PROTEIN: hypothetical protein Cgig2_030510 [Carnegiea gigantea]